MAKKTEDKVILPATLSIDFNRDDINNIARTINQIISYLNDKE